MDTKALIAHIENSYTGQPIVDSSAANSSSADSQMQHPGFSMAASESEGEVEARDKLGRYAFIVFKLFLTPKCVCAGKNPRSGYSTHDGNNDIDDDPGMHMGNEEKNIIPQQGISEMVIME